MSYDQNTKPGSGAPGGPPGYGSGPYPPQPGQHDPNQHQYSQGPPPPPQGQYTPQGQGQMNPQQMGEQYRAQLFAQCAQGIHQPSTKYGMCGIITAILCFPCGLICLFTDTEEKCDRCGIKLK